MASVWSWIRSRFELRTPAEIAQFEEQTLAPGIREFVPRRPEIIFRQRVEGPGVQRIELGGQPLVPPVGEFRKSYMSVVWFLQGPRKREYTARVEVGVYYWVHTSERNEEANARTMLNEAILQSGWLQGTWQGQKGMMTLNGILNTPLYFPRAKLNYEAGGFTGEATPTLPRHTFETDSRWEVRLEGTLPRGDATGFVSNLNTYPESI
jgi:hypothetical protein